jgi:hypothetical protein
MKNTHILNGDALLFKFPSSIPGEKIVFRECLVDGPVDFDSFEALILGRSKYLANTYLEPKKNHISRMSHRNLRRS